MTSLRILAARCILLSIFVVINVDSETCSSSPYSKVGCYKHNGTQDLLWVTPGVAPQSTPDWRTYLSTLVCQCSKSAHSKGFSYFGVKYYKPKSGVFYKGACFSSSTLNTNLLQGDCSGCLDSTRGVCKHNDKNDCTGQSSSIFYYKVTEKCSSSPYSKVSCYKHSGTKDLLWVTPGVAPQSTPDWRTYLSTLVCQCSKSAHSKGFSYFGVKYYKPKSGVFYKGVCFSSSTININLLQGDCSGCLDSTRGVCKLNDKNDCIGQSSSIFYYKVKEKCPKAPYTKVGCFDRPKAMKKNIIWITPGVAPKNMPSWKKYLSILVCQCSKAAKRRGFSYFGVKYFKPGKRSVFYRGACLTAPNSKFTQLLKSASKECLDSSKGVCNLQDKNDCIGNSKKSIFCYKRKDNSEDSDGVDGMMMEDGTDGDDSHTTDDNGEKDDGSDDTEVKTKRLIFLDIN